MADSELIKMSRRIQRLTDMKSRITQIPSVATVKSVFSEVLARRQFHEKYSQWFERHRNLAENICCNEIERRKIVKTENPVLNQFLENGSIPDQKEDVFKIRLSSSLPQISSSDVENPFHIPDILSDSFTQTEKITVQNLGTYQTSTFVWSHLEGRI